MFPERDGKNGWSSKPPWFSKTYQFQILYIRVNLHFSEVFECVILEKKEPIYLKPVSKIKLDKQ